MRSLKIALKKGPGPTAESKVITNKRKTEEEINKILDKYKNPIFYESDFI